MRVIRCPSVSDFRLASWRTVGDAVLTPSVRVSAGDSRDVELLAERQLLIRLVDSDGHDVQRADTGLDAGGLHAVVVAGVGSLLRDRIPAAAALEIQCFSKTYRRRAHSTARARRLHLRPRPEKGGARWHHVGSAGGRITALSGPSPGGLDEAAGRPRQKGTSRGIPHPRAGAERACPRWRSAPMTFGTETDEAGAHAQLDRFVEAGGNLVDTADVYSDSVSEQIIGRWLAARPPDIGDRVVLATKGAFPPAPIPTKSA